MDDDYLLKNKRLILCSLLPIVDNLFKRTEQLQQAGIQAFLVTKNFLMEFANSESDLDEYHHFIIEHRKENISAHSYRSAWIDQKKDKAFLEYKRTKKNWDKEFTVIRKNISKAKQTTPQDFQHRLLKTKEQAVVMWDKELTQLQLHYHKQIDLPEKKAKRKIYKKVLDDFSIHTGLKYIKILSTPNDHDGSSHTPQNERYCAGGGEPRSIIFLETWILKPNVTHKTDSYPGMNR